MAYRPRGALARALYDKMHSDLYLEKLDMKEWYELIDPLVEKYQTKFVGFQKPDDITLCWLEESKSLSANFWLQVWHIIARIFLGFFLTQTDINGILKRGSMFILSEKQFGELLRVGGLSPSRIMNSDSKIDMLDIGAGDGKVTERVASGIMQMEQTPLVLNVYASEYSWPMKERLQEKYYRVIDRIDQLTNVHLISCLNVLDRCSDPWQMMQDIYHALHPKGRVLVSLVLPYSHYVEKGPSHMPKKPVLPNWPEQSNLSFATEATMFFEQLELMGFRIEAWTKAPYLCEGDMQQSFYWLIDVVVVLSKK